MQSREKKIYKYKEILPRISENVFLAEGVKIIGDVEIDSFSSVWFNSVIRGDVNYITIGKYTNIQDLCMLHVTNNKFPLILGENVTVGHSAKLHGCVIKNNCLIGIGATILDGAEISEFTIIAAGAVIKPGDKIPMGKMVAGVPGRIIRDINEDEYEFIKNSGTKYYEYAKEYLSQFN